MNSKQLIKKDVINLIFSEIGNAKIDKLDLSKPFSVRIGNATVFKTVGNMPYIHIPDGVGKEYMSLWKNDVGKVLMNELKRDEPELYEIKTRKFIALAKKIRHEEEPSFVEKGFLHIKVGDFYFTVIKVISTGSQYYQKTCDFDPELYTNEDDDDIIVEEEAETEEKTKEEEKTYKLF